MKQIKVIMGMPITIEIVDQYVNEEIFNKIFRYFRKIDKQFSPFKATSEVSKINKEAISANDYTPLMQEVLAIAEKTKQETGGFFDVWHHGKFDPSGVVKGWAIYNAASMLDEAGFTNFYIDAGGDIQVKGTNAKKEKWKIGIKNPFNSEEIIKVVHINDQAIATSGTYIRGEHIYNPVFENPQTEIVSISVVGPNVLEADRFATAAFAMGEKGIYFIEKLPGFEGYMVDRQGNATYTSHFNNYCL